MSFDATTVLWLILGAPLVVLLCLFLGRVFPLL